MIKAEDAQKFFQGLIGEGKRFPTVKHMANYLNLSESEAVKLYKFLRGADTQYRAVLGWFTSLGGMLLEPDQEQTREVCFVDAMIVPAGEELGKPDSENYLAVPMVGEVGAGPGMIDQDLLQSWILVYRGHHSVQRRSDLLAVEIGRHQRSMIPTLHPEDIVLVDRKDWGELTRYAPPGNIYLVREPGQEGGGMVKRVSLSGREGDHNIIFYSDNPEYGPETYPLTAYDNNMRNAIVGKVVWAWTDLTRK